MNSREDAILTKIESMESRFESMFERIDARFERIEAKFESLDTQFKDAVKLLLYVHDTQKESLDKADKNFETLESRLKLLEDKVDSLSNNSSAGFQDVGGKIQELKVEVMKIQKVSNYSEEYENLLKISR